MSSKRKKSRNLFLLCAVTLLLILSYALVVMNHKKEEKEKEDAEEAQKEASTFTITNEEKDSITSLSIVSGDEQLLFVLQDDLWILQGEEDYPVDNDKVEEMVAAIASISVSKTVAKEADDLGEYGLSEPSYVITAKKADGKEVQLCIGDRMAVDTDYYAKLGDTNAVYILPLATRTKFAVTKQSLFAMPTVPSLSYNQLKEVQVSSKKYQNLHIASDDENPYDYTGLDIYPWYSIGDDRLPVNLDNTSYTTLLSNYISYDVMDGVDYGSEAMMQYGLSDPAAVVSIRYTDSDNKEQELTMKVGDMDENGNYYVSFNQEDRVYRMSADTMGDRLTAQEEDYFSAYVHLINVDELERLTIKTPSISHVYDVTRETSTDADGKETTTTTYSKDHVTYEDSTDFNTFYQKVISLKRSDSLTYSDVIKGTPILTITFELKESNAVTAEYYDYDADHYAVKINGKNRFTAEKTGIDELIKLLSE